jgi:hypothetical protein
MSSSPHPRPSPAARRPASLPLSRRRRLAGVGLAGVLTASSQLAAPGPAAAAEACTERNGWIPKGVVAPAVPGVTDLSSTRFADLDGDGDDDRLLLDVIGGIRAWRNDRDGNWSYRGRIAMGTGYSPERVKFADLNGDGKDDYFAVKDNGAVDAWINEGADLTGANGVTPGWRGVGQIARGTGATADQIMFGDLDGDGDDDFATQTSPDKPVFAWRNDGGDGPGRDGWVEWGQTRERGTVTAGSHTALVDGNCDGRDDLAVLLPTSLLFTLDNGGFRNGAFVVGNSTVLALGTGDPIDRITFAELNGDGRFDYLAMNSDGSIRGYLNAGGDWPS